MEGINMNTPSNKNSTDEKSSLFCKNIFLLGIILIFLFFSIFLIIFCLLLFYSSAKHPEGENSYVLTEYSLLGNESHQYIVKISKPIESGHYIHYSSPSSSFIISKFSDSEFTCTGSCYCKNRRNFISRRIGAATASIVSRSFVFLISAISTAMAISVAENVLKDKCFERQKMFAFDKNWDSDEISVVNPYDDDVVTEEDEEWDPENPPEWFCEFENMFSSVEECQYRENYEPAERWYHCSGHCVINGEITTPTEIRRAKEKNCEGFRTEAHVRFDIDYRNPRHDIRAKAEFIIQLLNKFCYGVSVEKFTTVIHGTSKQLEEKVSLCGTWRELKDPTMDNVECTEMKEEVPMEDIIMERKSLDERIARLSKEGLRTNYS